MSWLGQWLLGYSLSKQSNSTCKLQYLYFLVCETQVMIFYLFYSKDFLNLRNPVAILRYILVKIQLQSCSPKGNMFMYYIGTILLLSKNKAFMNCIYKYMICSFFLWFLFQRLWKYLWSLLLLLLIFSSSFYFF